MRFKGLGELCPVAFPIVACKVSFLGCLGSLQKHLSGRWSIFWILTFIVSSVLSTHCWDVCTSLCPALCCLTKGAGDFQLWKVHPGTQQRVSWWAKESMRSHASHSYTVGETKQTNKQTQTKQAQNPISSASAPLIFIYRPGRRSITKAPNLLFSLR